MPSFPPQMGVCLAPDQRFVVSIASESSMTVTGSMNTKQDKETISFPKLLRIGNLRHVAPYFIQKELAVGKLAEGKTIEQALLTTNLPGGDNSSIVKNVALIDWWPKELIAGRLIISKMQQKEQGTIATPEHLIQENEVLIGRYHFHEQSVLDHPRPTIVYDDENYIVVNKPGGIDVLSNPDAHRVVNSLPGIVGGLFDDDTDQPSAGVIIPAHRIDNPVSGLVCCGKTNKDAKRLSRKIQSRETIKTYLARVKISARAIDKLNNLPFDIEIPLGFDNSRGCAFVDFSKSGKASRTSILAVLVPPLDHDGTCVIAVRPHTGRKHQLRKHLSHIGLPIANDFKYNVIDDSCCHDSPKKISAFGLPNPPKELVQLFQDNYVGHCDHCSYVRKLLGTISKQTETVDKREINCSTAQASREDIGPSVSQPIWLHSWRYKFPSLGLSFEAPPPEWAKLCQSTVINNDALD